MIIDETPNGSGGYNISDVRLITIADFEARLGLMPASDFSFLAPGQERVYNLNGRIAETNIDGYNGKDWWQTAIVRPDQVCANQFILNSCANARMQAASGCRRALFYH